MKYKKLWALAALLVLGAGGGWFLWYSGFFQAAASPEGVRDYIAASAPFSHLLYFLVQFLAVVFAPIPSNLVAAAGGVLFGTWTAFALTFTAVTVGSLLTFQLARVLGRDFVDRLVSRQVSQRYQELLRAKAPVFLVLAFLFPFFPDDMLCILAGLTGLSLRQFALIVLLARPWGLLFACALGGASLELPLWTLLPLGLIGLTLFVLGLRYGDKIERAIVRRLEARRGPPQKADKQA